MTAALRFDHQAHLAKFKISDELLAAAHVVSVSDTEAREQLGLHGNYLNDLSGILFEYSSPFTHQRNGARIRLDTPLDIATGKGKYLSEPGSRHLYFPPVPDEYIHNVNIPIIIVEAEKSALAMTALAERSGKRMLAIATGGCWGWKRKSGNRLLPSGERETETGPSPDFDLINFSKRNVVIAFDSNAALNADVLRARGALGRELSRRGAKVLIATVPAITGVNGPDDLIAVIGDSAALEVLSTPDAFNPEAIPLISQTLEDFKATNFPPREPLVILEAIETPIFTARSLNQIFAWRGTGKTMVSLSLAGAIASGGKFLNMQSTRPARVLYVEGETPAAQIQSRANALIGPTGGNFKLVLADQQANGIPPLSSDIGRKLIDDVIEDAEVLVLDSISTLGGMPTNEEEEWIEFLAWLSRLRTRGLCVIFLHHAGKTGMQRGHSRSEDMLDISIKLSRPEGQEEKDWLNLKLEYDKFRGERTGVRSLIVECKGGLWSWTTSEEDKMRLLNEYLLHNPGASSRTVAKHLPELGSYVTVSKLMRAVKHEE